MKYINLKYLLEPLPELSYIRQKWEQGVLMRLLYSRSPWVYHYQFMDLITHWVSDEFE